MTALPDYAEALGTVLIIGAGLIEVWRPQRRRLTA